MKAYKAIPPPMGELQWAARHRKAIHLWIEPLKRSRDKIQAVEIALFVLSVARRAKTATVLHRGREGKALTGTLHLRGPERLELD